VKKRRLDFVDSAEVDLPDFSADWKLPEARASNAEIEARFYYEFARESETISRLTKTLCNFTRGEILTGRLRSLSSPGERLFILHPRCEGFALTLVPTIDLREIGWNKLRPDERRSLIDGFSGVPAFRPLPDHMLIDFAREIIDPSKPQSDLWPRWCGSSRLFYGGIEQAAFLIDWSRGPQAVKAGIKKWFVLRKRELGRLKSEGKLPKDGFYFRLKEETGAKNPKKKYRTALRELGAMRLLGTYHLIDAIRITKNALEGTALFSEHHKSAWNVGVRAARQTFQELFYPQDEFSLRMRRHYGLPKLEEPISYRRFCLRTGKNK
jgi:hypothetical protein